MMSRQRRPSPASQLSLFSPPAEPRRSQKKAWRHRRAERAKAEAAARAATPPPTAEQEDADLMEDLLFLDPHCNLDRWCE